MAATHRVFVVELDDLQPRIRPDRPNVYVGSTARALDAHLADLQAGLAGPEDLRGRVIRDLPELYRHFATHSHESIKTKREEVRHNLVRRGFTVWGQDAFQVYVIELDHEAAEIEVDKGWVYVGHSVHRPEVRFHKHLNNPDVAAGVVSRHGVQLLSDLYENWFPTPTREEARRQEGRLANHLRNKGYRVYSDQLDEHQEPL